MIRSAFATLGVLLLSIAAHAAPTGLSYAADYNVFTFGDLGSTASFHVVGRVAVNGNVKGASFSFGDEKVFPAEWTDKGPSTSYFTYIGGTNAYTVNSIGPGDVFISQPSATERVSANDFSKQKYHVYSDHPEAAPTMGYTKASADGHTSINFKDAKAYLTALSQTIANLLPNSKASKDGSNYTLTADKSISIFDLSLDEFEHLNRITTKGNTLIINVKGPKVHLGPANNIKVDGLDTPLATGNVLFNFSDATSIKLDDVLYGSILAPDANLEAMGNLKGQIIVKNLLSSGEIHAWKYTGYLPPVSTPEPSTMLLMGSGLLGIWNLRRRMLRR